MVFMRDAGHGPAVLLLHGAPSPGQELFELALPFADQRRVLVPDLPGYGESPPLEDLTSLTGVQASIEESLTSRGIDEVAVVGLSMGAYRALHMAVTSKVRVTAVVTLGGLARVSADDAKLMLGFSEMLGSLADFSSPEIRSIAPARFLSPSHLEQHPEAAAAAESWFDVTTPPVLSAELRGAAELPDLLPMLTELSIPVTAIVGEKDIASPPAMSQEIAHACPRGEFVVMPGHGHALTIEAMDETRRAVARGVTRSDSGT